MTEDELFVVPASMGLYVFVREYLRFRFDRWETVRSHHRKWPRS